MTFKEYQKEVKRTVVDLGSLELNLSHMILGIISENEEYLKAIVENDIINAKDRTKAGQTLPAKALFLLNVEY